MLRPRLRDLKLERTDLAKVITKLFIREVIVHLVRQGAPLCKQLLVWASRLLDPLAASKELHLQNSFFQDAVADTQACLQAISSLLSNGALAPVEQVMAAKSGTLLLLKNSIINSSHYKSLQKTFATNQAAEEQLRPEVDLYCEKLKNDLPDFTSSVEEALAKLHRWRDMLRPGP